MTDRSNIELLREYARTGVERAFTADSGRVKIRRLYSNEAGASAGARPRHQRRGRPEARPARARKARKFQSCHSRYIAYYNLVKMHSTVRCTPAMVAGVEGSAWSVADLVDAAA